MDLLSYRIVTMIDEYRLRLGKAQRSTRWWEFRRRFGLGVATRLAAMIQAEAYELIEDDRYERRASRDAD